LAIALVPAALYHLALTYPSRRPWSPRWFFAAVYAPFVAWAYLITMTNLIIDGALTQRVQF